MRQETNTIHAELNRGWLGDFSELGRRVGAGGGAGEMALEGVVGGSGAVCTFDELKQWMGRYVAEKLKAAEWPLILRAWELARDGKAQELIALDREWTDRARDLFVAEASCAVGRRQLSKLRPMRDVRVVQRYCEAVDTGRAYGWHPIVFGLVMAVYQIPLRQGLWHYAERTLDALASGVRTTASLTEGDKERAVDESLTGARAALEERVSTGFRAVVWEGRRQGG